jgi:hypothetical protein
MSRISSTVLARILVVQPRANLFKMPCDAVVAASPKLIRRVLLVRTRSHVDVPRERNTMQLQNLMRTILTAISDI